MVQPHEQTLLREASPLPQAEDSDAAATALDVAHAPTNRTIWIANNLDVMRSVAPSSVDLIYLDPPFNSDANYAAPAGSLAEGAAFTDTWRMEQIDMRELRCVKQRHPELWRFLQSVERTHSAALMSYLLFMAPRLSEMHRVLNDAGTIYLHCDPHASHYLKTLMDALFGERNFRNEIVWTYSGGGVPRKDFPRKHDTLLRYSKSGRWTFNVECKPHTGNPLWIDGQGSVPDGDTDFGPERGEPVTDWWTDVPTVTGWSPENVGYPTQKPLALLRRVIMASSHPGDIVLDPFCGSGTTCIAAEQLGRRWVGIDIEEKTAEIVDARMRQELGVFAPAINVPPAPAAHEEAAAA